MRVAILLLSLIAVCAAQAPTAFDGTWVLRAGGENIFKLTLETRNGLVAGALVWPSKMNIDQDGEFTEVGSGHDTLPVQKSSLQNRQLKLTIDGNDFNMELLESSCASLAVGPIQHWKLECVPAIGAAKTRQSPYPASSLDPTQFIMQGVRFSECEPGAANGAKPLCPDVRLSFRNPPHLCLTSFD